MQKKRKGTRKPPSGVRREERAGVSGGRSATNPENHRIRGPKGISAGVGIRRFKQKVENGSVRSAAGTEERGRGGNLGEMDFDGAEAKVLLVGISQVSTEAERERKKGSA